MLVEIMVICALTHIIPFYDCDQKWTIELYDTVHLDDECDNKNIKKYHVLGCSYYTTYPALDITYQPLIKVGTSTHIDEWGQNTLQHEIRHIDCRCKWTGHP